MRCEYEHRRSRTEVEGADMTTSFTPSLSQSFPLTVATTLAKKSRRRPPTCRKGPRNYQTSSMMRPSLLLSTNR